MTPIKLTFTLRKDAKPHLYIDEIKNEIQKDDYLHPSMRNALLLMKKARLPYIIKAFKKEIIIVGDKFLHLERSIEPQLTGFFRIDWSPSEIESYKKDNASRTKELIALYEKLGYELAPFQEVSIQTVDSILATTKKMEDKK